MLSAQLCLLLLLGRAPGEMQEEMSVTAAAPHVSSDGLSSVLPSRETWEETVDNLAAMFPTPAEVGDNGAS